MGSVLQVIDRSLDNEAIALKLLYPHLARDKTSFARFRNEVLVARRLSHPNIVRLYDFGQAGNGYFFISMEFVSGGSLGQMIYKDRRGPVPFHDSIRILRDIAAGISHAHASGVVHRDLKPDNILLSERGEVKITDFGLARTLYVDKGFTDTGEAVGTPYYMAPEQLRGDAIDGRTDIYALGIIAFETLVGRRPFFDESYLHLAAKHINEPIPDFVTKENGLPMWIQDFVQTAAAKKADERFQTADEVVEFLEEKMKTFSADSQYLRRSPAVLSFYSTTRGRKVRAPARKRLAKKLAIAIVTVCSLLIGAKLLLKTEVFRTAAIGTLLRAEQSGGTNYSGLKAFLGFNISMDPKELIEATRTGNAETVAALLDAGMDPNIKDAGGTPLLSVALRAQDYRVARTLLAHQANPDQRDKEGRSALMFAVQGTDSGIINELVTARADIDASDNDEKSVLMYAVEAGNISAVQYLMKLNVVTLSKTKDGTTPLMFAVKGNFEGIVRRLIEKSQINAVDNFTPPRSALSFAVERESEVITRMLVAEGASVTLPDGRSILDSAPTRMKRVITEQIKLRQPKPASGEPNH